MNPGVSMEANKYVTDSTALPAINNYRSGLVQAGGLGLGGSYGPNQAAAGSAQTATNAVTGGLGALTTPPPQASGVDWSNIFRGLGMIGL